MHLNCLLENSMLGNFIIALEFANAKSERTTSDEKLVDILFYIRAMHDKNTRNFFVICFIIIRLTLFPYQVI